MSGKAGSMAEKDLQHRNISRLNVWGMAFGCMVGWGAFVMPGTTFLPVAGPLGTIIAIAIGMVIMLVIGCNFTFLMKRSPRAGGVYSYTKEAFGRDHAFLCSWFLCLSYLTIVFLNGTALFIVLRTMFGNVTQTGFHYTISGNVIYLKEFLVSVAALAGVGLLFMFARNILHKLQTLLSLILIGGITVIFVFCIPHVFSLGALFDFGSSKVHTAYGIFSIVFLAPWAFVGFDAVCFDTEHFAFPMKKTGLVITVSIVVAAVAYSIPVLLAVSALPDGFSSWTEYVSSLDSLGGVESVPTFYAARSIMGKGGLVLIGITALAAVITGIIGGYKTVINVLSTMAEDKILSEHFSKRIYSILFIMIFSIALAFLGRNTLSWFVDLTSFGAIVGFGYTSAASYKIARTENNRKIKITGLVGTLVSVVFVIVQLVPRLTAMEAMGAEAFLLLSFWCLLGFIFYWRTVNRSSLAEYSGMSTSGIVLYALLVYAAFMWLAKLIASKDSVADVRSSLVFGGMLLMLIISIGLVIMLYVQNLVRKKHEDSERDKIRAVEGNLAKSQFLFNMSHDIRTPMNAIIGYTNLALKEDASEKLHGYLVKIDRSNHHLLTLINDILEMSRIENGAVELDFVPSDLVHVFEGVRDLFDHQMKKKKIDFAIYTSQVTDRFVWCDEKNFSRVIVNLLSNAYKFTGEGGSVSISIAQMGKAENGYGSYEIRVRDTGIGMSEEFAKKMFVPFERERTSTVSGIEGTGLGLAICKGIIDKMDGTVEVFTSLGNGTEILLHFKFRLAQESDLKKDEETKLSELSDNPDFSGKRLLLVEDIAINMEMAKMILSQYGFVVETAENGQIALDMVSSSKPGYYDAILMDIQMPVMDGYTATRKIRELEDKRLSRIPILAMTANAFKEDIEAAREAGMQSHIAKPIDVDVLLKSLAEVLK